MDAVKQLIGCLLVTCLLVTCLLATGCWRASLTPTATLAPEVIAVPHTEAAQTPTFGATPPPVVAPIQSKSRPVSIMMSSAQREIGLGQQLRVDLRIDPQKRGISGVQVQIEYDPAIFRVAGAEPGALLGPEPAVAGPFIDEIKGVVDYLAARIGPTEPPTPPGLFATLTFLVLETAPSGSATFLRITEVKIPDENIREIRDVLTGKELEVKISP